ncbi:hypothetical protein P261_02370 [Lachnospiraceae bacterium TWA4]|nr:hypothetical protein P261_02370 [Lachnospiraceae bacterium TWA4]
MSVIKNEEQIFRIIHMEEIYDEVYEAIEVFKGSVDVVNHLEDKIKELVDYYEGPLWMEDYDADSEGKIPKDLKHGVLSQDAIYDLLCTIDNIKKNDKY